MLSKIEKYLKDKGHIVIQCGHFALVHDSSEKLIPAIYQDIKEPEPKENCKLHPYMGDFPLETFSAGLDIVETALQNDQKVKLLSLVNDWQWVKSVEDGERNAYREEFYRAGKLPDSFEKLLAARDLNEEIFIPFLTGSKKVNHPYFWSEIRLRGQYDKRWASECSLDHGCAQEVVPMFMQLNDQGVDLFVNFVPMTCMNAVEQGAQKARQELGCKMGIINIYPRPNMKDFWEHVEIKVHV